MPAYFTVYGTLHSKFSASVLLPLQVYFATLG